MNGLPPILDDEPLPIPPLPGWIRSGMAGNAEVAAFLAGAALAHLVLVEAARQLPQALWRERLALIAAEVCVAMTGRREGQGALRDAVHLTRPGDDPGPSGRVLQQWLHAAGRPISVVGLGRAVDGVATDSVALCLDVVGPTPVERAAQVIEVVLEGTPRAETEALILADAVLSKSLGWKHALPLLSLALKPRDLRLRGGELRLACHRAVVLGAGQAVPLAADLSRRAVRLQAVAPRLRARGAARAVLLFLSRDALAPSALNFMSDRAARRLCDRLVDLGAIRELTGRDSFRLYGL